jgi:hypothetical protein
MSPQLRYLTIPGSSPQIHQRTFRFQPPISYPSCQHALALRPANFPDQGMTGCPDNPSKKPMIGLTPPALSKHRVAGGWLTGDLRESLQRQLFDSMTRQAQRRVLDASYPAHWRPGVFVGPPATPASWWVKAILTTFSPRVTFFGP